MEASTVASAEETDFSEEELDLFEEWFEEGVEVTDNCRYSAWVAHFHPTSSAASHVWMREFQSTGVSSYFPYPTRPSKVPTVHPKSCGRVLTSQENIAVIEEKRITKEQMQKRKGRKKTS